MFNGTILDAPAMALLSNRTAFDSDVAASPSATVTWQFLLAGGLQAVEGGVTRGIANEWWSKIDATIGNSHDVRCSQILSGPAFTAEAAAIGTYIQMSTTRAWVLTQTGRGNKSIVGVFQIVATGDTVVLAEGELTFTVLAEDYS